jgi:hypothetical protein
MLKEEGGHVWTKIWLCLEIKFIPHFLSFKDLTMPSF